MTTRLMKAIEDLSRMTERQHDARATALRNTAYPEDQRLHQRMLNIYADFMGVISKHALEVQAEDARELERQTS